MFDRMKILFLDRKYRLPRVWSNQELRKFAHLFEGDVLNVSAWKDEDKEGGHYRYYFKNARNYFISNYKAEVKGLQGFKNEFYLDLSQNLPEDYVYRFDVVFNHTTLEHIYEVKRAFQNLGNLSKDIVIIVVPFLQQMHGNYGDYWRFTPLSVKNLFEENGITLLYLSFNDHRHSSIYIFALGAKNPAKWENKIDYQFKVQSEKDRFDHFESLIGCRSITNSWLYKVKRFF